MKIKKIFVLAASILFLGGCNSFNGNSSSQQTTSTASDSAISNTTNDSSISNTTSDTTSGKITSDISSDIVSDTTSTSTSNQTTSENSSYDQTSDHTSVNSSVEVVEKVATINVTGVDKNESSTVTENNFSCSEGFKIASLTKIFSAGVGETKVKFGSGSGAGVMEIKIDSPMKVKSISFEGEAYGKDNPDAKITLSNSESVTKAITGDSTYVFDFKGVDNISSIKIESAIPGQRFYLGNIKISTTSLSGSGGSTSTSSSSSVVTPSSNSSQAYDPTSFVGTGDISDPSKDPYKGTYYSSISDTKTGDSLIRDLSSLIYNTHKSKSYDALWDGYKLTDLKPGTNIIWDMYSNEEYKYGSKQCGNYSGEGSCYNREHSVPQSWFGKASPMKSDIYHVVPTDGYVNNQRGNYPFGEVGSAKYTSKNGSKLGSSSVSGISGTVFEPIDEYKGDFARIYFYMATRYKDKCGSWGGGVFTSSYPYIKKAYFDLYMKWALEDPVSEKEMLRNEGGQKHQGNRNPYVDHPSYFYRAYCQQ